MFGRLAPNALADFQKRVLITLTGLQLAAMGANGNGNHPLGNMLVTITGLDSFTSASFFSTANAFEFSLGGVPGSSTLAMMAMGFAGLVTPHVRRNAKALALAVLSSLS